MSEPHCECTCGRIGCAARPGRSRRVGVTLHGDPHGYINGCRCDECRHAHNKTTSIRRSKANDVSRDAATKFGQQWTGAELEVAIRRDLTIRQIAALLGRSMGGVRKARFKAEHDPKFIAVVGAPDGEAPE